MTAYEALYPEAVSHRKESLETLKSVKLPARLEFRKNVPWRENHFKELILDGGHNVDALEALAHQLDQWQIKDCVMIFGMSRDKLELELVPALKQVIGFSALLITCPFRSPRSAEARELCGFLRSKMDPSNLPNLESVSNVEEALECTLRYPKSPVVIFGSFYLAGEVMTLLDE